MAVTSAVVEAKAVPPLEAAYHLIDEPVAVKLATVAELQNVCEALPVGVAGALMVAVTSKRVTLSQPETVCDAK